MPEVAVADMRLIAIVSGVAQPRAMIQDPQGVGHTVRRGAYIGRSEVVQIGGRDSTAVRRNWRGERIRPGEGVLAREDPVAPAPGFGTTTRLRLVSTTTFFVRPWLKLCFT